MPVLQYTSCRPSFFLLLLICVWLVPSQQDEGTKTCLLLQDTTVRQMLKQNTVLTLGASSQNIDWKNIWQRKLDADDSFDASNDRAPFH